MRKICLLLMVFGAFSCSTDQGELGLVDDQILEANAVVEVEGCDVIPYNFGDAGIVEVTNDDTNLFVTIIANSDYVLEKTRLHVANNIEEFPTVGNGNLPPAKMEMERIFEEEVDHYTFTLSLDEYGDEDGIISIASFSTFAGMGESNSLWAGNAHIKFGNWSYFDYQIQTCEVFQDPCNFINSESYQTEISESFAVAIPTVEAVTAFYLNLIEEEGVPRSGTFDPKIKAITDIFEKNHLGEFKTTYTVTKGECTDSVILVVNVIPD